MSINVENLMPFEAPTAHEYAGRMRFARAMAPYDEFMESEGLSVIREIGIHDTRELDLTDWPRMGGRGTFVQLLGTEELWGMYVVEIPAGGALNPEHHLYEEVFYVVEGRGATEVWIDERKKATFEWHDGSLFSVPLNTTHRLVNATRQRALLIVATTAPPVLNHFRNVDFVFNCDYAFRDRYQEDSRYFDFNDSLFAGPADGRAMMVTSLVPDIVNASLPLDNQRSPGYRRVETHLAQNSFYTWLGEHDPGKYSKAHRHPPSPILVCLRGEGYTYTWPRQYGAHPFADGHGEKVLRADYVPGGMVAAAPGGGDWFHQHFGVSAEPLRFLYLGGLIRWGAFTPGVRPGEERASMNLDVEDGGGSVAYANEDPFFRQEFEQQLARRGVTSKMDESLYSKESSSSKADGPTRRS